MKKTALIIAVFIHSAIFAQAPQKMSYQAVVRDNNNLLVANQSVGIKTSVLQGSSSGASVYVETHTAATNTNGLASFEVGNGTIVSGSFDSINWANGPYFIKTEIDPNGGANYSITGSSELLSVPYALYSPGTVGPPGPMGLTGATGADGADCVEIISVGDLIVMYTDTYAYGFSQDQSSFSSQPYPDDNAGQWTSIALNDTVVGVESSEKQIVIYTNTYAYGFSQDQSSFSSQPNPDDNAGQWTSIALSGTPLGSLHSKKQVVVYTTTHAYGFSQDQSSFSTQPHPDDNAGQWTSIQLSGTPVQGKGSSKNIVLYTTTHAYGFSQDQSSFSSQPEPDDNAGQWTTIQLNGTPKGIIKIK